MEGGRDRGGQGSVSIVNGITSGARGREREIAPVRSGRSGNALERGRGKRDRKKDLGVTGGAVQDEEVPRGVLLEQTGSREKTNGLLQGDGTRQDECKTRRQTN